MKPCKNKDAGSLAKYVKQLIPKDAMVVFLFKEDFDGDGQPETIVGYTLFGEIGRPLLYVMHAKITKAGHKQAHIVSTFDEANGVF